MKHETQIELIERVLAYIRQGSTDMANDMVTLDTERYYSAERLAEELAAIFRVCPLAVGHVSQVAAPGDFFTHDLAGQPLLLCRARDGSLGAFLNVCRHRGTRVVGEACGHGRKSFVCPYHGWTYGADGRLLGVPHDHGFPDLDRDARGLVRLAAAEVGGLVWVHLGPHAAGAPDTAGSIRAFVGPLGEELHSMGLAGHHLYDPRVIERPLNWKLAVDTFLEAYHVRTAHRQTIARMFFDNLGVMDMFEPHIRSLAPKQTFGELAGQDRATWRLRDHANVIYMFFPNVIMIVTSDYATVFQVFPRGTDRCVIQSYSLIPAPPDSDKARSHWELNNRILYDALEEDYAMGASIQAGVRSGANQEIMLGRFEHALACFHRTVDRYLAMAQRQRARTSPGT